MAPKDGLVIWRKWGRNELTNSVALSNVDAVNAGRLLPVRKGRQAGQIWEKDDVVEWELVYVRIDCLDKSKRRYLFSPSPGRSSLGQVSRVDRWIEWLTEIDLSCVLCISGDYRIIKLQIIIGFRLSICNQRIDLWQKISLCSHQKEYEKSLNDHLI